MKWSSLGKVLVRSLPLALELTENLSNGNASKKAVFINLAHDELKQFSPELASHPKVIEAVGKAADVLVEVHNEVAKAQSELAAGAS